MRMLTLFCGEGLACWGYWLSGCFTEIVGIDVDYGVKQAYAFDFICGDALNLTYDFLMDFDFIHASPPCQAYSKMTPKGSHHPRLIKPTHQMLTASGVPYVIENVEGSGSELRPNLRLYGKDFGLPMSRPRYFHVSTRQMINVSPGANDVNQVHGGKYLNRVELIKTFGLECIPDGRLKNITMAGIEQGIPPAMTKAIAQSMFKKVMIG